MQPKKYDSFSPKRATNIDGFLVKPTSDRPRQPIFRTSPANPQETPAKLADMPRRASPQTVLASSAAAQSLPGVATYPLGGVPRERHRRRSGEEQRPTPKQRKPRGKKQLFKRASMVFGALVLVAALWFGFKFYKDIARLTGNHNPFSLLSIFHPAPLKNQNGRVNVLVAANSADDKGHNGANLTDSLMVLSINTRNHTAMMLSIPRDLWVDIPGYGHAKINEAYPDGGMGLLQQVVQDNLGMTIDYRALVNYGDFRDLVNAVGGITITIKSDDPRGIYDPDLDYTTRYCCALAKYSNGKHTLNGKQALNLARARGDAYGSYGYAQSDFTRTMYQRKMLLAIKDKADQPSVIANPFKVSSLVDAVGKNVRTNLKLNEIETLYTYMKKIDDNKIDSYNINSLKGDNTSMLSSYTTPTGQSALVPAAGLDDFTDIQRQIRKLFTADPVTKEGAVVVVLNATDTTGLALRQENELVRKGMDVSIGDASANQATNTLIDNSGGDKPNTLKYLLSHYHATVTTDASLTAGYPGADFILILGHSAVPATTAQAR